MAEAFIPVDQDQFSCPVCLDLLKDPVTLPCGHSYCNMCINGCWDQEHWKGFYSCPQCRETFTPRPVLRRNNMLAEVVEKLKTEVQAAPSADCYAGPGDVECDFCTGRKLKAVKSCLVCLASFCETHLKPHLERPALKKHTLIGASSRLQDKICSQHGKLIEVYCYTDQKCICSLCMFENHKGHDTVLISAEKTKKQNELKEEQMKSQQRIQDKEKKVQELKQAVNMIKSRAQTAMEDSERIFTEMISSMTKKQSEVIEQIRSQEKADLSRTKRLLKQLNQEISALKRKVTEMEKLSHTSDHTHFLQSFRSLGVSSGCEDSPSITVDHHHSFDVVRNSLSHLKKRFEEFCKEEFNKIASHASVVQISPSVPRIRADFGKSAAIQRSSSLVLKSRVKFLKSATLQRSSSLVPKSRADFLKYFWYLTLDPNTTRCSLSLSQQNRVVTRSRRKQLYSDHPERFDFYSQVLCKERLHGRCYWEVEWNGVGSVHISVSYKDIRRKGQGKECGFGRNSQSWSLRCSSLSTDFIHDDVKTQLRVQSSSKIGVFVDHSGGILSFYNVSDMMRLIHTVHTTFTQPLYAGFGVYDGTVRLCQQPQSTSLLTSALHLH